MPIPSGNFPAVLFLLEIDFQCQLIEKSAQNLERAAKHWIALRQGIDDGTSEPPREIIATCIVCLSAIATIRRILLPLSRDETVRGRCTALVQLLGKPDLPNISYAGVRNSWEHIDERLDRLIATRTQDAVAPIHVSPDPPEPGSKALRWFNPITFSIHFTDQVISIGGCINEAKDLRERINLAYEVLHRDIIDLYPQERAEKSIQAASAETPSNKKNEAIERLPAAIAKWQMIAIVCAVAGFVVGKFFV